MPDGREVVVCRPQGLLELKSLCSVWAVDLESTVLAL